MNASPWFFSRVARSLGLLGMLTLTLAATRAVPAQTPGTHVSFDLSVAPTINWLNDVEVRLRELQETPAGANPDSLTRLFDSEELPMQVGFKAGIMMTISRGWLGLRPGVNVLNAGGVFDGANYLNEEKLRMNFVTFLADLQLRKTAGLATFYAFGGPEFRYRVDLTGEDEITVSTFQENMDPLSTAATFGAGIHLNLLGYSFAPEVRYAYDLSGVSGETFEAQGATYELSDAYRLNNLAFGLVLGL